MGKSSSTRGRSPQPPSEKGAAAVAPATGAAGAPSPQSLAVPGQTKKARSKSRSRSRGKSNKAKKTAPATSYKSDGVEDNDVFLLPVSDYLLMLALTAVGTAVRVYKIYNPGSVVFDEVQ
jgi:dolichyl-phosphate-mannose-protein mannosyltransferase